MLQLRMAETLGSLCDKLTIIKLKQWHSTDKVRLKSLAGQEIALREEIDAFVANALAGRIHENQMTFRANKVYRKKGNAIAPVTGAMGAVVGQLADVNCRLWHEQEKVYDFDRIPDAEKGVVVKQLAVLNLERTRCMEAIDQNLLEEVLRRKKNRSKGTSKRRTAS